MEVLNAAGLVPVSVHKHSSDRKTKPKKLLPLMPPSLTKLSKPTALTSSLALLSAVVTGGSGAAGALTYEEALDQSMSAFTSGGGAFDLGGNIDSLVKFATENPPIVIGVTSVLAVPLVLSQILGQNKSYGVESARNAYAKLSEDGGALLLDIRPAKEIREVGSPDLRSLKKKAVAIEYRRDDKPGFLKKLSLKFKEPENTTLFILDKFDGSSELVAELVTVNGFKAAYAIKDGVEGPRGWIKSSLPWLQPKKALSIDFGELQDSIASVLGEGADGVSVSLVLAAVTGLGLLAYAEVETLLQVLGSVALIQLASKKLLFAEDRKQTIQQVDEFLTTKVAPGEFVDEIKLIGKALLPAPFEQKALPPATAEGNPSTEVPEATKVEAAAAPPPVNSVPNTEVKAESISGIQISNPQHLPLLQSLEQSSNTAPHARQKKNPKTLHEVLSSVGNLCAWLEFYMERKIKMPTRDVVSWTGTISGYSKSEVNARGPLSSSFDDSDFGYREDNSWTFHQIWFLNLISDQTIGRALIEFYCNCNAVEDAKRVHVELVEPCQNASNLLIEGLVSAGRNGELRMQRWFFTECLIQALFHIIDDQRDDKILFSEMPERTVVSANTLIFLNCQNGLLDEALQLFENTKWENSMISALELFSKEKHSTPMRPENYFRQISM
ncbi:hypothetical protein ACLOJK_010007 [Asimina triloba]